MEAPPSDSLAQKKAILEYWSLVEFFSPYLLDNALDSKKTYQKIYASEPLSYPLPWLNSEIIPENDSRTPLAKGYQLYLGLFNIEETADRARHVFTSKPSDWQSMNWKDCKEGSLTAFARLLVSTHGIPLFSTLSLSTLPWAHGVLLNHKQEGITIEEYWKSVHRLVDDLKQKFLVGLPKKLMKKPDIKAGFLDLSSLYQLVDFLFQWASYRPLGYPLVLIEPLEQNPTLPSKESFHSNKDIPILNSFYIQDLEAARNCLSSSEGEPIDLYLSQKQDKRISIESSEGEKEILRMLKPENTPAGRFPDPTSQNQSVMQQFAINAAFTFLQEKGIFSVNGPPGTGKTSLLREIIAENIVLRAKALAQFKSAQSAFIRKHAISFENFDSFTVSELDPSLIGYEMVIVSSNNSAVQNISKELPLRSQLDFAFHHASYLEPVAAKVLEAKEGEVWGLVSASLGNKENCQNLAEKLFFDPSKASGFLRIWEWINEYKGPSFLEAKEAFIKIQSEQERLYEELEWLAYLHDEIHSQTVESFCSSELKALEELETVGEKKQEAFLRLLKEEEEEKELFALLQEQEKLLKSERPHVLARVMNRSASNQWKMELTSINADRLKSIKRLHTCKMAQKEVKEELLCLSDQENAGMQILLDKALLFHLLSDQYEALKRTYPSVLLPCNQKALNQKEGQNKAYYQAIQGNQVRTELFIAALQLHEAWLAETLSAKGGFLGNLRAVANILQGKTPTTANDTTLVWQSLFLLIPVISSTFASIHRLFRYLEPATLGWVLIDEAGQASPQVAVGAIWRAKRVFCVGDPFQIEPICSIPEELVDGMAKIRLQDHALHWAPSQISVQHVIDRISVFGSERTLRDENYWISSPLRVHRRCLEPMFTISNMIAYESSMVNMTQVALEISLPQSCWWDVKGNVSGKHYVADHGVALIHLLKEMLKKIGSPDIYIISPFREVIVNIQPLLIHHQELSELFLAKFPSIPFSAWVRASSGTVHTFQGKQTHVVFFVLGGDLATRGPIEWASRKPNLLNVAVTRAKSRFYIIGDYDLWKTRSYFDVAAKKLKRQQVSF